jgi:mevalonate kinase
MADSDQFLISKVPAKLIISGEHSVLYNNYAVTSAIPYYMSCSASFDIKEDRNPCYLIYLPDINYYSSFSIDELLSTLDKTTQELYNSTYFLAVCTIGLFCREFKEEILNCKYRNNIKIEVKTDKKILGFSGIGSSAMLIVSIIKTLSSLYKINISNNLFLKLAIKIENIQHGKSSGIDIKTVFYQDNLFFFSNRFKVIKTNLLHKILIIDTGKACSTKDSVEYVAKKNFDKAIWRDFEQCTTNIFQSLCQNSYSDFLSNIITNNNLLNLIGIIPKNIYNCLQEMQFYNYAAKISGAGTITGQGAGIISVFLSPSYSDQDIFNIKNISKKYLSNNPRIIAI